jgi:hypothetical protein
MTANRLLRCLLLTGAVFATSANLCQATTAQFSTPASALPRNATVLFDDAGGNLTVTLTNLQSTAAADPTFILTAVFFQLTGDPALTSTSATLAAGSTVLNPSSGTGTDPGGVVGGEWAYKNGLSQTIGGGSQNQGISSAGLGIFGPATFPGSDLDSPSSVNGLNYGIAGSGGISSQGGLQVPLIQNSVVFVLGGLGTHTVAQISNVAFQFGTALTEPGVPGVPGPPAPPVPEPSTMFYALTAFASFGLIGIRRRYLNRSTGAVA